MIKRNISSNLWLGVLMLGMLIGGVSGVWVLINGLGATNLTDLVPWGLWISIDISAIALSAGAFSICAAVYLFGIKRLEPLARTAAWIGLVGYTMAMCCLLMDIGRPDRFWYGFVFWNIHSVLWEVTMCVGLYFTVLLLENLPTIANLHWFEERFPKAAERMHKMHNFAPVLAIFGLFFSLLHQSSLGATYGVIIARPVWYRPGLAVLFIVSAVVGGLALTLFSTSIVKRVRPQTVIDPSLLNQVSRYLAWMLIGYLYLRFWDLFAMTYTYQPGKSEGLSILTSGPLSFNFWFGEIIMGALVPLFLLLNSKTKKISALRDTALLLIAGGVVAYRWDINLLGQLIVQSPISRGVQYTQYMPSLIEYSVGLGVISLGLMIFTLGVRYLRVVDHSAHA